MKVPKKFRRIEYSNYMELILKENPQDFFDRKQKLERV
jgi:hypothetical protein